jgi:hypothetical protein
MIAVLKNQYLPKKNNFVAFKLNIYIRGLLHERAFFYIAF